MTKYGIKLKGEPLVIWEMIYTGWRVSFDKDTVKSKNKRSTAMFCTATEAEDFILNSLVKIGKDTGTRKHPYISSCVKEFPAEDYTVYEVEVSE